MKIAVFIKRTTFHKGYGGLETQNKVLCEELVKRGHKIIVFSPKAGLEEENKILNKVNYRFIKADYYYKILSFFNPHNWAKRSYEVFKKLHKEEPFDIVLSQSSAGEGIIKNKKELAVPVITISHGSIASEMKTYLQTERIKRVMDIYWLIKNIQYFLRMFFGRQRLVVLHADKVIAVSSYIKEALIEETFCSEDKIEVVNNGIDPRLIESLPRENIEDDKTNIIYIGRIDKSKGIYELINIFNGLTEKQILLHIVGGGPELENLKSKNDNSNIIFYGMKKHEEALSLLKGSDIFVFPTKRIEGFPMVLVEAAFCKLPIVAFNKGGVRDMVIDNKTGHLIEEKNIEEFKIRLRELIKDINKRKEFGQNNYHYALQNLTILKMIDKYEKIMNDIFKGRK